jgi:dinuclear metal center YbgI/SA1388 family protein
MTAILSDIIKIIEKIAPLHLAEEWDNSGLQIGQPDWQIETIWVSLDPAPDVIGAAVRKNVDLLVTHHPLIFNPIHSIDFSTPLGAIIKLAAQNEMAVYAAHTNLDSAASGINDFLSHKLELDSVKALGQPDVHAGQDAEVQGLGRVGRLKERITLDELAKKVKAEFNLASVKVAGRSDMMVETAAVCSGSGASLLKDFFASDAQVYITGDLKYHDARAVEENGCGLIDIGHFGSEHLFMKVLAEKLRHTFAQAGIEVSIKPYDDEKDPFVVY